MIKKIQLNFNLKTKQSVLTPHELELYTGFLVIN